METVPDIRYASQIWRQQDITRLFPMGNLKYFAPGNRVRQFVVELGRHARGRIADLDTLVWMYRQGSLTLDAALQLRCQQLIQQRNKVPVELKPKYDILVYRTLVSRDSAAEDLKKLNFLYMSAVLAQHALTEI